MSTVYTNIPSKHGNSFENTVKNLTTGTYVKEFEFSQNEIDVAVAFFVKRGFDKQPAQDVAHVILRQAKIDSIPVTQILDILSKSTDLELNELMTVVFNSNRYKTSRLGVRQVSDSREIVSRNIVK